MVGKTKSTIILVLVVLLLLSTAALVFSQRNIQTWVSDYVLKSTNRKLSIDRELHLAWGFPLKVYAEGVRVANDPWGRYPELFTADRISISFSFLSLLKGDIRVDRIEMDSPQLWIEQHPDSGKFNTDWKRSNNNSEPNSAFPQSLQLTGLTIRNGQISFQKGSLEWNAKIDDAKLYSPAFTRPTQLQLTGWLQGTPLSMSGNIGSVESLTQYQESTVDLSGYIGMLDNNISVTGVVADLLKWRGLNLWCESYLQDLSSISNLVGIPLPQLHDVVASWEIIQPDAVETMRLESILLESSDDKLDMRVAGSIGKLSRFDDVDLVLTAKGPLGRGLLPSWFNQNIEPIADISARLGGGKAALAMDVDRGIIEVGDVRLDASGRVDDVFGNWSKPLTLLLKGNGLGSFGELFEKKWPETSAVNINADLYRINSEFALTNIVVSTESSRLSFLGKGVIESLGDKNYGKLQFRGTATKSFVSELIENPIIAKLDQVAADGIVVMDKGSFSISDLSVNGKGKGISIMGAGEVSELYPFQGLKLNLDAKIDGLDKLNELVDRQFPSTAPITLSAILKQESENEFGLRDISGSLVDPSLQAQISGNISDLGPSQTTQLAVEFSVSNSKVISALFPQITSAEVLTQFLPIHGTAELNGVSNLSGNSHYALNALKINSGASKLNGQLEGTISDLFTNAYLGQLSLHLSGDFNGQGLPSGMIPDTFNLPLTGWIESTMDMVVKPDITKLDNINLSIDFDETNLEVKGNISQFSPLSLAGLELTVDTEDIAEIINVKSFPIKYGIPATAQIGFRDDGRNREIDFDVKVGSSDIKGTISPGVHTNEEVRSVPLGTANIYSNNLDLNALLVEAEDSEKFFSDNVLKFDWLQNADLKLDAIIKNFSNSVFTLSDLKSSVQIKNGRLDAQLHGESQKGPLELNFELWERDDKLDVVMTMRGKDVDLRAFTIAANSDGNEKGVFSLNIDLSGQGKSVAEIMGNANGNFGYELRGAKIRNEGLQLVSQDLFFGLLTAINPLTEKDDFIKIDCNLVRLKIENGIAKSDQGLALKSNKFTLIGSGKIDLASENIDFVVTTKARKGLGINTNTFAKLIGVGGTINKPEFKSSTQGILQTGVAIGAAFASGGVSLIAQGLFDRIKANSDVCNPAPNIQEKVEVKVEDEK